MERQMVSVYPEELSFVFELDQQSYCNLKLVNKREHHVAFKIKTTAPSKYFVGPNTGIIQPWDSVAILVTLQAQREYPPDMQCKDKFLVQSAFVTPSIVPDEVPPETFNKDGEKKIEERKLRVVYTAPSASNGPRTLEDHLMPQASMLRSSRHNADRNSMQITGSSKENQAMVHLREERENALKQQKQLQHELEFIKKSQLHKSRASFSLKFTIIIGLAGIVIGYILNLSLHTHSGEIQAEL